MSTLKLNHCAPTLSGKSPRGRYLGRYNTVTPISMPVSGFYKRPRSSVPTKEVPCSLNMQRNMQLKVNTFRSAYIVSALLSSTPFLLYCQFTRPFPTWVLILQAIGSADEKRFGYARLLLFYFSIGVLLDIPLGYSVVTNLSCVVIVMLLKCF